MSSSTRAEVVVETILPIESHCDAGAFTDSYGIVVQAILAALAFASLVLKRFCEPKFERRPWLIWFFDTSKQAAGAGLIHALNVFLAPMFQGDPCTWYVVSFLLDSTLGLFIIYIGVKITSFIGRIKNYPTLKFGEYGKPPQCRPWFHQSFAFFLIILVEKLIITLVLSLKFWSNVRKIILSPIKNPKVEVTVVMLIIPFFVNLLIFWCVDNFTMKKLFKLESSAIKRKFEIDEKESREKLLNNSNSSTNNEVDRDGFTEIFINDDRVKQRLNSNCSSPE